MNDKQHKEDKEYRYREENQPSPSRQGMDTRNNNENNDDVRATEPNVETANDTGLGDSGLNDDKLTNFTSNHSADA